MSEKTKWSIEADFLQACNCDYGCPCEFSAPPTTGFCEGMGAWRINKGSFGDLKLDGLGTACLFFDERATQPQRDALLQICSGQVGGMPFEIIVHTFSKFLEPQFVPF